jgi:hypothetical protein
MAEQRKTLVELIEAYDTTEDEGDRFTGPLEGVSPIRAAEQELAERLRLLDEAAAHRGWEYRLHPLRGIEKALAPREAADIDAESP